MNSSTVRALELLRSPHFFTELLSAVRSIGLVGEERTALVIYIGATSRLLDKPICLFVKGPSGVGKNFVTDSTLRLFPDSEVQKLTSSSNRSWNHLGNKLEHKIVYVKERNEAAGPVHPTRLLISENELVYMVTNRENGKFVATQRVTKGPIAAISTTTAERVQVDDETRHISIWLDESSKQTSRILMAAFEDVVGLAPEEIRAWHQVQELIKRRASFQITFPPWFQLIVHRIPTDNLWTRRYFSSFLQACRTIALIRSFVRDDKRLRAQKAILVRYSDFAIANLIFNSVLSTSLRKADYEDIEIRNHVERIVEMQKGQGVGAMEISRELGISLDRVYGRLRKSIRAGTIVQANRPAKSNVKLYVPAQPRPFLPEPRELLEQVKGLPRRVKFVHPLKGEWVTYTRQ
jgi:hypothetical protein